jgi:hypothetical protein
MDFFSTLFRTSWKKDHSFPKVKSLIATKLNHFPQTLLIWAGVQPPRLGYRTGWKINSYPTDFFTHLIRTPWNFFRTRWKRGAEIIQESGLIALSIYTFLFIHRGDSGDVITQT